MATLTPRVIIFSDKADEHTLHVVRRLPHDVEPIIVNLAGYGADLRLHSEPSRSLHLAVMPDGTEVRLSGAQAYWWRRPFGVSTGETRPAAEFSPVAAQIVAALSAETAGVNDPFRQQAADIKARQLIMARQSGLAVPETLLPDTIDSVLAFAGQHGDCVVKDHSRPSGVGQATEYLDVGQPEQAIGRMVQRFVRAAREHRLICIDGETLGASFDLRGHPALPDIRGRKDLPVSRADIPLELRQALATYCDIAGLRYAAFDIREAADGFYFLEANTAGQWLYVDGVNDGAITGLFIGALLRNVEHGAQRH